MTNITAALPGLAVGDALGVPAEFVHRPALKHHPVTGMQGYGTHQQPPGTWSDDNSLAFCLAESLCHGYDLTDLARRFVNWRDQAYWTAHGRVFNIGIATSEAISRLRSGTSPVLAGGAAEADNGNGSLIRILPLIAYLTNKPINEHYRIMAEVSSLTHAHVRSVFACFIYCEYALLLLDGADKMAALQAIQQTVNQFINEYKLIDKAAELILFQRVLENPNVPGLSTSLLHCTEAEIASSRYVLHTLEASLWCFLTTDSYAEAVLKAVNLGSDTDTTGCVTGGLAGLCYGADAIPKNWLDILARKGDIIDLGNQLTKVL